MAHFAEIDSNNVVTRVIVGNDNETEATIEQRYGGTWKQTSFNNNIRGRYAGIGFTYHSDLDIFSEPQPFSSWIMNSTGGWDPPVARPADSDTVPYSWDEDNQTWNQIT